ncbi:DUF6438 domain-containing protein [Pedobacter frigoris]|uniref:DUF6438 domain-containing protein n=1 Tax=Pedobacter frigoris TaxID=2571272 RepID=A0A4U1CNQ5_9SPHI|nr:DUF6438 domain-containing protein [Pedobacter frigoris]TKC09581.1 hypothetical protein FA047_05700 [Pedobacter frigoris]
MKANLLKLSVALLLLSLIVTACKKDQKTPDDSLVISYGLDVGLCYGYCNNKLTVKKDHITLRRTDNNPAITAKVCEGTISAEDWNALKASINLIQFSKLNDTYGCPGCTDGGISWVEITYNGTTKRVTFDSGKEPANMSAYLNILRQHRDSFKDCN